jgi:hypothetical protein
MAHDPHPATGAWLRSRNGLAVVALSGAAGLYLLTQHWTHAAPYLPWLLFAACPLLHVFMHRGHGGHGPGVGHGPAGPGRSETPESLEGPPAKIP